MNEMRRWDRRAGNCEEFRRAIDPGHFKPCLDEKLRQWPGSAAHVHHSANAAACSAEPAHNFGCRTACQRAECHCLDMCKVPLVQ